MYTYLTPEPVTLEIFNPDGDVTVELSETSTTTVNIEAASNAPMGFIDDLVRSFGGRGKWGDWNNWGANRTQGVDVMPEPDTDLAGLVRVEHVSNEGEPGAVIVDADVARRRFRTAFHIKVTAPNGSNVRIKGQSTDVRVAGIAGIADIRSASGNIEVTEIRDNALLQTASGNIGVRVAGADLDARSVSGDVRVGTVAGRADLETTSGDSTLERGATDVRARSVSGNVRVDAVSSGQTDAKSVSGNIVIGVTSGIRAAIDLHSLAGRTESDFDVKDQPSTPAKANSDQDQDAVEPADDSATTEQAESSDFLSGDVPVSGLSIKARSASGNIRLRRAQS